MTGRPRDAAWEATTWEGARRAQLRAQAALPAEDRLRWLEEALRFAWETGALARRRGERRAADGPQG